MFPAPEGRQRVFTRPGAITSKLSRAWGVAELKKVDGQRVKDDRHHAVDAVVLAATTESLLQRMTGEIQRREGEGRQDDIFHVAPPWPSFRRDVMRAIYGENGTGGVFVSRAERRRGRGKAHDATVRQMKQRGGETLVYERKPVDKLTENDLSRIKDAERNHRLVSALRTWFEDGKPKDRPPTWKYRNGDGFSEEPIRKVRLVSKGQPAILLNGGTVDRGEMIRIDVFESGIPKSRSRYLFVPVYSHHVVESEPPNRAFTLRTAYVDWRQIKPDDQFLFSINKLCLVEVDNGKATPIVGYFRKLDSNDGRISITPHHTNSDDEEVRVSPTKIRAFNKFIVDRLGRRFEVLREVRTWRGRACT